MNLQFEWHLGAWFSFCSSRVWTQSWDELHSWGCTVRGWPDISHSLRILRAFSSHLQNRGVANMAVSGLRQELQVFLQPIVCKFFRSLLYSICQATHWRPAQIQAEKEQISCKSHSQWTEWKLLSCVWLFVTPWTLQFMEFSRPEYWTG